MKAKKVIALVMCAAMVAGMSASSVMAADMPEQFKDLKANEAYDFPMMVKSFQSTYWDAAQEGMKKAADELGVTYKAQGPNSESDIADQVNMINTAIASNPVGLGLAACDTSSVQDALKTCAEKGIPVVTFDTGIADAPEGSVVCEVCTDNAQAGAVAAENMYFEEKGAYTGEISPNMLTDAGVKYVVLGHSERREYFAETDETVNKKVLKAFEHGITPIVCCGETLAQREQGVTIDFVRQQIKIAFQGVSADQAKTAVIAYEPIWAIGTGKVATTEQAQEVCAAIRACIAEVYDEATAEAIRIQYGGSVSAASAPELFAQPDIDGGLVGGASLKPDFGKIVNYK